MAAAANPDFPSPARLLGLADQCVQCGLCLPHCPTYRLDALEAESPRGRIAYMKAVAAGALAPGPVGDLHLDHCLGCLRCQQACPADVRYDDLLTGSRAWQAQRTAPSLARRLRLGLLAHPRWLAGLLGLYRLAFGLLPAAWRPLPKPPAPRARPAESGPPDAAVFIGCIARGYEAPARDALRTLASRAGLRLSEPDGQGCCGTAASHAGDAAGAARLQAANAVAFRGGAPVLCLASGCRDGLQVGLDGTPALDPLTWLEPRAGHLRFRASAGQRVALHLPCTQRGDPAAVAALRRWLGRIPGLDCVELPDTGCCGAAGLHQVEHPARAAALRAPLLEAFARTGAGELLSANIGCRLHLGAAGVVVRHPLEFLAAHLADPPDHP